MDQDAVGGAGEPRPVWVFASSAGTTLDESNVRKAFNRLLDAAELDRRGPHQMRHDVQLYTNDKAQLGETLNREVSHRSAIELGRAPAASSQEIAQSTNRNQAREHTISYGLGR
jgi:hypothetical protein